MPSENDGRMVLGYRVWGIGSRVGLGYGVQGIGCWVMGVGYRVVGVGYGVLGEEWVGTRRLEGVSTFIRLLFAFLV